METNALRRASEFLAGLPPEYPEALWQTIRARVRADGRVLVVLDDDPTGTQTVHDVNVLTAWSVDLLRRELEGADTCFYVLTNSRGLPTAAAQDLNREIARNLQAASRAAGRAFVVASRSDSTLRGHYPAEIDALGEVLGIRAHLVVPAFFEGGRYTIEGVHYVREGDELVPAALTEFARDRDFGYAHSDLREWIEEKSRGRWRAGEVGAITLDDLRRGGPQAVSAKLSAARGPVVTDAASYADLDVLVAGLLEAEARGQSLLYRTAASFVRVRAGIDPRPLLTARELEEQARGRGVLIVVGSYVARTTRQIERVAELPNVEAVELSVPAILDPAARGGELQRAIERVSAGLDAGRHVMVYTSRAVAADARASLLSIGPQISNALVELVRRLDTPPRLIIAKGGITSSDVATAGLSVQRARVLGQIRPGVPVWQLGAESRFPGMSYVVFPGNVGDDFTLAQIVTELGES